MVTWKGLVGPYPLSSAAFEFEDRSPPDAFKCCRTLCAMDGLVIPGTVKRWGDSSGEQLYAGDVVILIDDNPCGCTPR